MSKPTSPTIRPMQTKDLDEVIELGLITPELQTETENPQFFFKKTLLRWIDTPYGVLLVADAHDSIAGFIISAHNPTNHEGELHVIAVRNEWRRKGLGSALIEETLKRLAAIGCNHIKSLIAPDNEANQMLLQKYGFSKGKAFYYFDRTLP